MVAELHVLFKFAVNPYEGIEVDTTAGGGEFRGLSPFVLGPVKSFGGMLCRNVENFWQYHKVYKCHVGENGEPTLEWYEWAQKGFNNPRAVRYPMGKGTVPEYSFWNGEHLTYVEARKMVYIPYYAKYVQETNAFKVLKELYSTGDVLVLRDFDEYDHVKLGKSLKEVVNDPTRKCGHVFVLAMILTGVLEECVQ